MIAYFDTSVLLAAFVESHPDHAAAASAVQQVRAERIEGCVSTHGLAEVYAVLTRLPLTPAVHPAEAWQMLRGNIYGSFLVIPLSSAHYEEAIRRCAERGWAGGRIYDQLHLEAARGAGCEAIFTLHLKHFRELAPDLTDRIRRP